MDNKYIRQLKKSKGKVRRKLYAAIALMLTATVMVSSVSYAWMVLSRNPEVTGVSTTVGSNGNLEIALATSEHLDALRANNMYENSEETFVMATGDPVHDNVLWGNLVDLTDAAYGLHTLTMRPAILNILDGKIAQVPVTVAGYGTDGRLDVFDPDNLDLEKSGLGAIYNTQTARCDFGSVTLPRTDLEAGLLDQEEMLESILDNTSYGLRLAGPMKYSGSYDEESDNVTVDFYVDGYCFAVDMLLRTNASVANLMLQTEATQRMESQLEEEYQGQGSFIQLENPYMTAAMSAVIPSLVTDMDTQTAYSVKIGTNRPFRSMLTLPDNASVVFLSKAGTKVTHDTESLADLFQTAFSNTGVGFASVDLRGLDTSAVTDMSNLFRGCSKLTRIRLTGVDTSAVTNMNSMFRNCLSLTSLDLSGFDTSKVTDMGYMFAGPGSRSSNSDNYSKLSQLDISGWDLSNVTSSYMFQNCPAGNKQ